MSCRGRDVTGRRHIKLPDAVFCLAGVGNDAVLCMRGLRTKCVPPWSYLCSNRARPRKVSPVHHSSLTDEFIKFDYAFINRTTWRCRSHIALSFAQRTKERPRTVLVRSM